MKIGRKMKLAINNRQKTTILTGKVATWLFIKPKENEKHNVAINKQIIKEV